MKDRKALAGVLRWLFSIGFFFLAINKAGLILKHGLDPYVVITGAAGLPKLFSYYGIVAVIIEFCFAVGVWIDKVFRPAILVAGVLIFFGIIISVALIAFKVQSECGCGLLGDNEYGLLTQKVIIMAGLIVLYKNKRALFVSDLVS